MSEKSRIDFLIDSKIKKELKVKLAGQEKTITQFLLEKIDLFLNNNKKNNDIQR